MKQQMNTVNLSYCCKHDTIKNNYLKIIHIFCYFFKKKKIELKTMLFDKSFNF